MGENANYFSVHVKMFDFTIPSAIYFFYRCMNLVNLKCEELSNYKREIALYYF